MQGCSDCSLYFTNLAGSLPRNFLDRKTSVETLTFYDTPLDNVDPGAFNSSAFTNTTVMWIEGRSLVPTIKSSIFEGLANLRVLYVLDPTMDLNELPKDVFSALTSLRSLKINFAEDHRLDLEKVIGSYESVQELDLGYSWIEVVPAGVFDRLPNLEYLSIWYSRVVKVEPGAFDGLPRLRSLYLGYNEIKEYPVGLLDAIASRETAAIELLNTFVCDCSLSVLEDVMSQDSTKGAFLIPFEEITCWDTVVIGGADIKFIKYQENCNRTSCSGQKVE